MSLMRWAQMPYVPVVHPNSPLYSAVAERHPRSTDGSGLFAAIALSRHLRGVKPGAGGMSRNGRDSTEMERPKWTQGEIK